MADSITELQARLAKIEKENEELRAKQTAKGKDAPAYIKDGLVHFPGIGGITGVHLNPDAFVSVVLRLPAVSAEFAKNEAKVRAAYAARPPFEKKGR